MSEERSLSDVAKHAISRLLVARPHDRLSVVQLCRGHPIFWSTFEQVRYLGETIGSLLQPKTHRDQAGPFVQALEEAVDTKLGKYCENNPAAGGSWARLLDPKFPIGGWGNGRQAQQPPNEIEHLYHVYGGNPSRKQEESRKQKLARGEQVEECKQIRTVGLLKFIRNVCVGHGTQNVQQGRFESEQQLCDWCLSPFPWLLPIVFDLEQRFLDNESANYADRRTKSSLEEEQHNDFMRQSIAMMRDSTSSTAVKRTRTRTSTSTSTTTNPIVTSALYASPLRQELRYMREL
eukprot:SAG31_NODE_6055_length_2190_cov_1.811095_2_plen_291_part_00